MPASPSVRWWEIRPAQNAKPVSYTCPLCHRRLLALSAHALMFPEGDHERRRHAHMACVIEARRAGRLPTREEFRRATEGPRPSWWRRLIGAGRGSSDGSGGGPDRRAPTGR